MTSASPIISAAAVEAVRSGLRREFCVAMRFIVLSGITPGNSSGQSGSHLETARTDRHRQDDQQEERIQDGPEHERADPLAGRAGPKAP